MLFWITPMLCLFLAPFPLKSLIVEDTLHEANLSYQKGEQATTFEERKQAFNRALYLYSLAEQKIHPHQASLDQAIGDSYFHLGEYAWAILYYERALKEQPVDPLLMIHLKKAQAKLGLSSFTPSSYTSRKFLLLKSFFLPPKRFELFFWITLITFFMCSAALWFSFSWIRTLAAICLVLIALFLSQMLFSYYFIPIEGIIITSTGLYRNADQSQPQLTNEPLFAGSKVQVLQITAEGNWLKIEDSAGLIGYVPATTIRLI